MNLRQIPRTAVVSYLRLVRAPLDGAIALLPGNGTGPKPAAKLAVDRADAAVRSLIAGALGDRVLLDDARRRQLAAEERSAALRLRTEAERTTEAAQADLAEREQRAVRQREQAAQRAREKRQQATRDAEQKAQRAVEIEQQRLKATQVAERRAEEAIAEREPGERLEALNTTADALEEKEQELVARDEARRLREAASRAKAERKSG